jgi:Holliday junction DNA helicase RuvA
VIASIRGTLLRRTGNDLIIDVSGIGYRVTVADRLALGVREGEDVVVHTAYIPREDQVSLYGFDTPEELDMFDLLRSVTGVGPKSAMAVLSQLSAEQIYDAIAHEDDSAFRSVSGIGPKTAKLIVLSLQGSFERKPVRASASSSAGSTTDDIVRHSVVQALVGLGWSERVAKDGVQRALEADSDAPVEANTLLRQALTILGPHTNREARS